MFIYIYILVLACWNTSIFHGSIIDAGRFVLFFFILPVYFNSFVLMLRLWFKKEKQVCFESNFGVLYLHPFARRVVVDPLVSQVCFNKITWWSASTQAAPRDDKLFNDFAEVAVGQPWKTRNAKLSNGFLSWISQVNVVILGGIPPFQTHLGWVDYWDRYQIIPTFCLMIMLWETCLCQVLDFWPA